MHLLLCDGDDFMLGSLNFVGLRNFLSKFAVSHIHTFSIVFVAKLHLNFAFSHTILMRVIQIMLIEIHLVQYSNTYTHLPGQIHQMFNELALENIYP